MCSATIFTIFSEAGNCCFSPNVHLLPIQPGNKHTKCCLCIVE